MKPKLPFNMFFPFLLVFALVGLYWLSRLGLEASSAYLWLLIIGIIFISLGILAKMSGFDFWFEVPVDKSNERAVLMFVLGLSTLGILAFLSSISGMTIYNSFVMAPLASFTLSIGSEQFSALSAVTDLFWTFFIVVICASVIEEIVLGWGFVTVGSLGGMGLRNILKLDYGRNNKNWDFTWAMIFSVILFAILHVFNNTYKSIEMFIWAGMFRLILNILIYKLGNFGLMFSIGVHAMNNAIFLGSAIVITALTTFPAGLILDAFFVLIIIYLIYNWKEIINQGKLTKKDFITDWE